MTCCKNPFSCCCFCKLNHQCLRKTLQKGKYDCEMLICRGKPEKLGNKLFGVMLGNIHICVNNYL